MVRLEVQAGGLKLKNPIILASGTCGYGNAYEDFYNPSYAGAIVTKGISIKPREGNIPPRICETEAGILNSIGLENVGVERFISDFLPLLRRKKAKVIVNIFGEREDEYIELADILGREKGVSGIELNLSCPNVSKGGLEFGRDKRMVRRITGKVKARSKVPLWVKLSASRTDVVEMARAAEQGGADGVVVSNTLRGMAIDLERKKPVLGGITGGLSGPAIKPVALASVYEAVKVLRIDVIGCGGIFNGRDALEFLLAGAKAVEVGTALMVNPLAPIEMIKEIENYLSGVGIKNIDEWIGTLKEG